MTSRSYPRLAIEPFGEQLLLSGDLDPVYIALSRMEWDERQRAAWLVAYWCTYHCGFASWVSGRATGGAFWEFLGTAAANSDRHPSPVGGRWPRAPERRHWRGHNAVSCVEDLKRRHPEGPEGMIDFLVGPGLSAPENAKWGRQALDPFPFGLVASRVQEHVAFGPWIAFKVADMLERVCGVDIDFGDAPVMYDSPRQAAVRVFLEKTGQPPGARPRNEDTAIATVVAHLQEHFRDWDAPPGGGRKVGLQEIETILCKWGSHMNGHYPLNNDLVEIRAGAEPWAAVSRTAGEFLHWLPRAEQAKPLAVASSRG